MILTRTITLYLKILESTDTLEGEISQFAASIARTFQVKAALDRLIQVTCIYLLTDSSCLIPFRALSAITDVLIGAQVTTVLQRATTHASLITASI